MVGFLRVLGWFAIVVGVTVCCFCVLLMANEGEVDGGGCCASSVGALAIFWGYLLVRPSSSEADALSDVTDLPGWVADQEW